MSLTADQMEQLEEILLRDRRRILRALARHNDRFADAAADHGRFSFSQHMAEQGAEAMNRERAFLRASEEGRTLIEIDRALERLYRGAESYGRCRECGETIRYERLEAVPQATRCIACQIEQEEGA